MSPTTVPDVLAFVDEPFTLRVGVPDLDFIAPHELDETDPVAVLVTDVLTDGLTSIDPQSGLARSALADTWRASGDGLTWTFTLGNFAFSSGNQITADDVVASLNQVAARGLDSLSGPSLWPVEGWLDADATTPVSGIRAIGDDEVEFTLTTPFADIAETLGGVVFGVAPGDLEGLDLADGEIPVTSSAEFVPVAVWEDGIRMQGDEVPGELSAIELFLDPDGTLLAAGEVDLGIGYDSTTSFGEADQGQSERNGHVFFAMDASDAPLDDPLIRQAILHAIDRDGIRDEFFPDFAIMDGFGTTPRSASFDGVADDELDPADAPVGGTNAVDACGLACDLDLEEARLLVDASSNRDVPLTVDYFFDSSVDQDQAAAEGEDPQDRQDAQSQPERQLAEAIAETLREIGLDATAVGHDPATYGESAVAGDLGLFRFGSVSTSPSRESDLAALFETNGLDNITGISIDRFDEVIEEARNEFEGARRQLFYAEAETILFGEAALAPLVTLHHDFWFNERLDRVGLEPDGSLDFAEISIAFDQFNDE